MAQRYSKTIQYGKESSHGTHVAANTIFLGDASIPNDRTPHRPQYNLGTRVQAAEAAILYKLIESFPISMPDSYFQGLHLFLATTLKGGVSGTEQTTGQHDYKSVYTPSLVVASADSMDSVTLEVCDGQRSTEMGYVMGRSIKFTWTFGKDGKLVTEGDFFADFVDDTITKTAGLSLPTSTLVNPNLLKIYADSAWAGLGTTLLSGLIRQVTLEIIGGAEPRGPHGNATTLDSHGVTYLAWKLGLVLEDNDDADDFYQWFRAQTAVAIRLLQDGPAIGTGDNHSLKFDLWGAPDEATPMAQEENGEQQMTVSMSGLLNTTSSTTLACELTTDKQAL